MDYNMDIKILGIAFNKYLAHFSDGKRGPELHSGSRLIFVV